MISRSSLGPILVNSTSGQRQSPAFNGTICATLCAIMLAILLSTGCSRQPPPAIHGEPVPADVNAALNTFHAEGTRGWAFTQTTATEKEKLVEHYDPSKPDDARWTLIQKDGHPPSDTDLKEYTDKLSRRGGGDTAPDVTQQLDRSAAERLQDDAQNAVYRFRLKPTSKDDSSAAYMTATFTFDKVSHAFEKVELSNIAPFAPMFAVRVKEAQTVVYYQLPTNDRPTLLDHITVKIRGRALLIRSLDEDMNVSYSDYKYVGQRFAHKIKADGP